ncbi:hypothetical protein GCM10027589_24140 [Actinocorallia lasiicapitis]
MDAHETPNPELTRLGIRHPGWRIRLTRDARSLIATRLDRDHVTEEEQVAGVVMTVIEDSPERLSEALALQAEAEATV